MMFQVTACFVREENGWRCMTQVPTFFLDGNVQGLLNREHAEEFAVRMVSSVANVPRENVTALVRQE